MLRMAYVVAVRNNLYFVLGAISLTLVLAVCMEWKRMEVAAAKTGTAQAVVAEKHGQPAGSSGEDMALRPAH